MGKHLITVETTCSKTYEVEADSYQHAVDIINDCTDCTYDPFYEPDTVSTNYIKGKRQW